MKLPLLLVIATGALITSSLAQAPATSAQRTTPPAPITAKDVRTLPYCREQEKKKVTAARDFPDELRVVTTTNKIHLYGKKRVDNDKKGDGKPMLHVGKLALLTPADRAGKLIVKSPSADDATYYYAVLELDGDNLETKRLNLTASKTYDWSATSQGGQTTVRISADGADVATITAPTEKVKGIGFASTVRWKNNEADLTITLN